MVPKITERISDEKLQQDLERYRQQAVEMGATDAKIIRTDQVVIDERVLAKCTYPRCSGYGTSANCPPHAMSPDLVRKVVGNFTYGIFAKLDVPPGDIAGKEARQKNLAAPYRKKIAEIVAKIESQAFYDGYYLAVAFGSGACKAVFCRDTECVALTPGKACPHRLKARSPMEAVGMDVFAMAAKVGWDVYPIGSATSPSELPSGMRAAVVFIA